MESVPEEETLVAVVADIAKSLRVMAHETPDSDDRNLRRPASALDPMEMLPPSMLAELLSCRVSEVESVCLDLPGFPLPQTVAPKSGGRKMKVWPAGAVNAWMVNDWVCLRKK